VTGVGLTAIVAVLVELIGAVNSLVVARFLQPRDYAIAGVAALSLSIGYIVRDLRIADRLVQMPGDPAVAYDAGFTLEVRLSLAYVLVALAAAPLVTWVYGDRLILPVMLAMSAIGFMPAALLPSAQLRRDLDWWRQRLVDAVGPVAGLAVTLPLAIGGAGPWALVAGPLASLAAQTIVLWIRAPRRPRLLRKLPPGTMRFFLSFGVPLWLGAMIGIVSVNVLTFTVTATMGLAALGFFRVAGSVGDRIDRAEQVVSSVLYPVLCRIDDPARLRRSFVLTGRLILLWAVPTGVGLAVFAPEITHLVLGRTWDSPAPGSAIDSVVPLLRVEGVGEVLNAVATTWVLYYQVLDRTRSTLPMTVAVWGSMVAGGAVLIPLFHYTGLVATLALTAVLGVGLRRQRMRAIFPGVPVIRPALPLLLAGGVAAGAALAMARPFGGFDAAHVVLRVAVFLVVYAAIAVTLERRTVREALALVRAPQQS
jgi:PST family polysaccharide transporter